MIKLTAIAIALVLVIGSLITPSILAQEPEVTATTTTSTAPQISVSASDIQRGLTQTVHINTGVPADVIGKITYPSGHQTIFQGTTDETGQLDYSFKVGGNSKPGTATVDILASTDQGRASASTTFGIYPKGALIVITPEPLPPVIVVEENETSIVTEDNASEGGIEVPIENVTVVIPTNETIEPPASDNSSEVIVVEQNETEIVTGDNASESEIEIPDEVIDEIGEEPVIIAEGNESTITENVTAPVEVPITENTTTAPEEPIVIVDQNETVIVTPDNSSDINVPINESSVIIPSNETTVPEPVENETEVIIAPENETEVITGDNASEIPQVPDDVIDQIEEEPAIIVEGNETTIGENITASEPLPDDVVPIDNATNAGNVTDIIVVPPSEQLPGNITAPTEELPSFNETTTPIPFPPFNETQIPPMVNVSQPGEAPLTNVTVGENVTVEAPGNITVGVETPNGTVPLPPLTNVTDPDAAIDQVEEATEVLDEAVNSGNVDEIIAALQEAIQSNAAIALTVDTATNEQADRAEQAVANMNEVINEAFSEVSEGDNGDDQGEDENN